MRAAVLLVLVALALPAPAAAGLRAGVARVDITPSTFMQMYGYAKRKCGPANGTHDPLFAKVLVLEAGGSRMALVTADVGSLVSEKRAKGLVAQPYVLCFGIAHHRRRHFCRSERARGGDGGAAYLTSRAQDLARCESAPKPCSRTARHREGIAPIGLHRLLL